MPRSVTKALFVQLTLAKSRDRWQRLLTVASSAVALRKRAPENATLPDPDSPPLFFTFSPFTCSSAPLLLRVQNSSAAAEIFPELFHSIFFFLPPLSTSCLLALRESICSGKSIPLDIWNITGCEIISSDGDYIHKRARETREHLESSEGIGLMRRTPRCLYRLICKFKTSLKNSCACFILVPF